MPGEAGGSGSSNSVKARVAPRPNNRGMNHRTDPAPTGRTRRHVAARRPTKSLEPTKPSPDQSAAVSRGLKDKITWLAVDDLKPFPHNPRHHPEAQIARLMRSIEQVWTNPILIDETGTILAGHGRWEAAKRLGRTEVPTLTWWIGRSPRSILGFGSRRSWRLLSIPALHHCRSQRRAMRWR